MTYALTCLYVLTALSVAVAAWLRAPVWCVAALAVAAAAMAVVTTRLHSRTGPADRQLAQASLQDAIARAEASEDDPDLDQTGECA